MLPFTHEQFVAVFVDYNRAIWPLQLLAYALGTATVGLLLRPLRFRQLGDRAIAAILALMWAWTGLAYHATYFSAINKAAWLFAALFVVQGVLLLRTGVVRARLRFESARGPARWLGWALVGYAGIGYPLVGVWSGHAYPEMPVFGITPCPLTIFTFGLLVLARASAPYSLLVVPLLWSLVGGSAAFLLDVPQDWPLLASGVAAMAISLRPGRRAQTLAVPG